MSFIGHKEFRFLLPIIPLLLIYAGVSLDNIREIKNASVKDTEFKTNPKKNNSLKKRKSNSKKLDTKSENKISNFKLKWNIAFIILTNVISAFYLTQIHQRGVVDVIYYLKNQFNNEPGSVIFLMPCHSTPLQSILHNPHVTIKVLGCEPPLNTKVIDEAKVFYENKNLYLDELVDNRWNYLVIFQVLTENDDVKTWMDTRYIFYKRFFNSHWHWDEKRKGDVMVYKRID